MPLMWIATCENCKRDSAVRPSCSTENQIELANPSEKIRVKCPHCHHENEFCGSDLRQESVEILPSPPQF
jgi:hypothetical protein